jgi:hypothetical protein
MVPDSPGIVVLATPVAPAELARLVSLYYGDMVKYVVDVDLERIALGGRMHADAEKVLRAAGSNPSSLWGAKYFPGRGRTHCIEYTSQINVRPSQGNPSVEILDPEICARVQELTFALIGTGEKLPGGAG